MILTKYLYSNLDVKQEIKNLKSFTKKMLKSRERCRKFIENIHRITFK